MGDHMFKDTQRLASPFIAEGYIDKEYDPAWMCVGVLQIERVDGEEPKLLGAAYGMGPAAVEDPTPNDPEAPKIWSMQLQFDSDESRYLYNGAAIGFVLAQLPGGKMTGWIDETITLEGGKNKTSPPPAGD